MAVAAAGTAEDSSGSTTVKVAATADPGRRRYIARVDHICGRLDPERNAARDDVSGSADQNEAARAYGDTITLGTRQLHEIEAVTPPAGDADALRANVFEVIRRQLAVRGQMAAALAAQDTAQLSVLRGQLDSLTRSLIGFARGYGFRVCGED